MKVHAEDGSIVSDDKQVLESWKDEFVNYTMLLKGLSLMTFLGNLLLPKSNN